MIKTITKKNNPLTPTKEIFTNLITIMSSDEILDHNVLRNRVNGPTSQSAWHDQTPTSTCVCLLPIADQLKTIQFT